jgi:transposase-like protein
VGVVQIDEKKRVDWNAIRAEYIGGGISQRQLAKKYGVTPGALMQKANREHWQQDKEETVSMALAASKQSTAEAVADNAKLKQEIVSMLLSKMRTIAENIPSDATEKRKTKGRETSVVKLKDLTSAYKDLTADMSPSEESLKAARLLLEGIKSAID